MCGYRRRKKSEKCKQQGKIPVLVDPHAAIRTVYQPDVLIDAILAKKNLGTEVTDAPFVIGVGPGFTAGEDCHCVIETKRGHTLGSVIFRGTAIPNTGIPGDVGGYTIERLLKSTAAGVMEPVAAIGDLVQKGEIVAYTGGEPVYAKMTGIVRGMLQRGVVVEKDLKIGDIDARCEVSHCFTISDKARAIGGGVLEAVVQFERICRKYAVIVLAAGNASRFGSNKVLADVQGKPLYCHMLDKLAGLGAFPRILVTGYEEIGGSGGSARGLYRGESSAGTGNFSLTEIGTGEMQVDRAGRKRRFVLRLRSAGLKSGNDDGADAACHQQTGDDPCIRA